LKSVMGLWIWFFPATYLFHILEESVVGERFYNWTGRLVGRRIPVRAFLALNGIFLAMMIVAVFTLRAGGPPWLLPVLGTMTAVKLAPWRRDRTLRVCSPACSCGHRWDLPRCRCRGRHSRRPCGGSASPPG